MHVHFSRLGGGRHRRLVGVAVAGSTLVAGIGGVGLAMVGAAPAGAAGTSSTTSTPADCTPSATGSIGFTGTLSNVNVKIGGSNSLSGTSGTLCGVLNAGTFQYTIPKDGVTLNPSTDMFWGFLPFPTTEAVTQDTTGSLTPGSAAGTYDTSMSLSMTAVTNILWGFPCNIGPLNVNFTTGTSGTLTGTPLAGSLVTQLQGNLVSNDFTVPAIQSSSSCPSFIAGLGNLLSGFPLKAGQSTITASVLLKPVLPGSSS